MSGSRRLRRDSTDVESDRAFIGLDFGDADAGLEALAEAFLQARFNPSAINETGSAATASENALPSVEARYRVLVEQIPAVVFMAFLDGGVSEAYVSPHIENMLGFSQEEWLDDPIRWYQQIHPDDKSRWSTEAAQLMISGNALKSTYRVLARDGRVVWFRCEAKLVRKPDGQPWFIHGVGFDVTELKETELALQHEIAERERLQRRELERQIERTQQTEARLAAIVESSEDAIIGKTLDGIITSWNAAASDLFGYRAEEVIGNSMLLLVPPALHAEEVEILQTLRSGGRIRQQESQRVTKTGLPVDVSLTISPIKNAAGQVVGASTIARDITERKRAEHKLRVTEKLAATGRLAATISHEINNPLEAVTNFIYLAKGDPSLPEHIHAYLETADRELQRVSHIARQTLGFYRDTTSPVDIDVAHLLSEIIELYRSRIEYKKLRVKTCFGNSDIIRGLQGEIRQVFSNIIANAIEASSNDSALTVRVRPASAMRSPNTHGVRITIADHGVGIPPESRRHIFEPFFSTKQDVGTGLGLWVSKGLVEKHSGSIRFRSSVVPSRRGTVFSVFLPRRKATE
jgi:PAS domain S-box-containing protein